MYWSVAADLVVHRDSGEPPPAELPLTAPLPPPHAARNDNANAADAARTKLAFMITSADLFHEPASSRSG
jgi:hypothetical protein